jgi:tetratricopeptide (TPR) repeat protein
MRRGIIDSKSPLIFSGERRARLVIRLLNYCMEGWNVSVQENSCVSDALPKSTAPCNTAARAQEFRSHAELKPALQRVEKRLASQPDSVPLLFLRGNLLNKIARNLEARNTYVIKCGEPEKVLEHLEHALKIDPDCRQAHAGLSFALANLGKPEQASRHRRTAFQGRCVIPAVYRYVQ